LSGCAASFGHYCLLFVWVRTGRRALGAVIRPRLFVRRKVWVITGVAVLGEFGVTKVIFHFGETILYFLIARCSLESFIVTDMHQACQKCSDGLPPGASRGHFIGLGRFLVHI